MMGARRGTQNGRQTATHAQEATEVVVFSREQEFVQDANFSQPTRNSDPVDATPARNSTADVGADSTDQRERGVAQIRPVEASIGT
jgi:hypothetical protein